MVQTCSKCSRANPADAVYCYFDGFVLGGGRNGAPVAVGAKAFSSSFVFPGGRECRSFDELALACQQEWDTARHMLEQGYLETFFGGLGRMDLALAAKEAARFPDRDRGLDQLLTKLPSDVLAEPQLVVERQEVNLGVLSPGAQRDFNLHLENQGMRLVYGTIICADDAGWLAVGEGAGTKEKHFQFTHELDVPVHVRSDRLRASNKPLETVLEVESNGGSLLVTVRAEVPVTPFPSGVLAGAKSPRQVAEKAKAKPKVAAGLFENGAVAEWYKSNGWTYPVQGPAASGLGAVQQFFEALGLTPPPKVDISTHKIELSGSTGEQLTYTFEVKSQEKRPVYAHATSNQPWLEVGRARLNGRVATINLSVPSVPDRQGETLTAKLLVQSNGNQRFVVPVTLQIGHNLNFTDPEPVPVAAIKAPPGVTKEPSAPVLAVPAVVAPVSYRRRRAKGKPAWMHLLPALLLLLGLGTAVVIDLLMKKPLLVADEGGIREPEETTPAGEPIDPLEAALKGMTIKNTEPRLIIRYTDEMRFGLEMANVPDPKNPDKFKRLTYEETGSSNNTIVKIDGYEFYFGEKTPNNVWRKHREPTRSGRGMQSTMEFRRERVFVTQHVEIVPGRTGLLDTCLVYYTIQNKDTGKHRVGIRVMIDTFIGANDGVPFTIPGRKGFVDTKAEFSQKQIPAYIEVIEKPDDPKDPGTVARMGLKNLRLPGVTFEDMTELRIGRWPGKRIKWDWPLEEMAMDKENPDSCVAMYWNYEEMEPAAERNMGFTYGLGELDVGTGSGGDAAGPALALSAPASAPPDQDFVVTAYVWRAKKGDKVKLHLPRGLRLADGESEEKTIEEEGKRSQVFWRVRGGVGTYKLEATTGDAKSKPRTVVVQTASIFG
jgi:hypothetical protein